MKTKKIFMLAFLSILLACGGAEETEEEVEEEVTDAENCTYSYDETATTLTWTAFKLTEKVGVDGTFDEIRVVAKEADNKFDVLNNATFEIPVSSINTQDTTRDGKIRRSFFAQMDKTDLLTGEIISIDKSAARVSITMNGVSKEYDSEVKVKGEKITMITVIDIRDFDGQVAMDSLSVVCAEKHTGPDNENKLWTDVSIAVSSTLKKTCE